MRKSDNWWLSLSPSTRECLLIDPRRPLTPELVRDITQAGGSAIAAYWVESETPPGNFYLPADLVAYVETLQSANSPQDN